MKINFRAVGLLRKYTFLQKYFLLSRIMQVLFLESSGLFLLDNAFFKIAVSMPVLIGH